MFEKNRVTCILLTQSVTLFFLYFCCPHELESWNMYNKDICIICMICIIYIISQQQLTEITQKNFLIKFSQVNFSKIHKILDQFDKLIKSYIKMF